MSSQTALLRLSGVAVIWGCNNVVSSYLLHSFNPIFLSFIRILLTSLFLLLLAVRERNIRWPNKKEWLYLMCAGFFGTFLNQLFYFLGLVQSTAGNAALIVALAPIATLVLARFCLKEDFTRPKLMGCILAFTGVVSIILFRGGASGGVTAGDAFLIGAMLSLAISLMYIRLLTFTMTPFEITLYSTVFATFLLAPAAGVEAFVTGLQMSSSLFVWGLVLFIGIVGQCLAGILWNGGIAVVGAGTASMFMNVPPFIALIVAHFTLGDPIYGSQIIGGILILLGVAAANRKRTTQPKKIQDQVKSASAT